MKTFLTLIGAIGAIAGIFAGVLGFILLSVIFHAWALKLLWLWFIVPIFGLAPLTYGGALGVSLVVGLFRYQSGIKEDHLSPVWNRLTTHYIGMFLSLGMGWIVHTWWM